MPPKWFQLTSWEPPDKRAAIITAEEGPKCPPTGHSGIYFWARPISLHSPPSLAQEDKVPVFLVNCRNNYRYTRLRGVETWIRGSAMTHRWLCKLAITNPLCERIKYPTEEHHCQSFFFLCCRTVWSPTPATIVAAASLVMMDQDLKKIEHRSLIIIIGKLTDEV